MTRLLVDFSPRTLRRAMRQTHAVVWLCFGLGILLCASAGLRLYGMVHQYVELEHTLVQTDRQHAQRTTDTPVVQPTRITPPLAASVNAAIRQLNLPWRELFDALEAGTPTNVALLGLDPDASKGVLRGMAEAKSFPDMIAYIAMLKRQPFFTEVVLMRHETNEKDPNKPLRFQFEANWLEDAQ